MTATDTDFDDDFDCDEGDLSPQMRDQLERLIVLNKSLEQGGRTRRSRAWIARRRIEDWRDARAIQRSVDYLIEDRDLR